MVSHHFLCCKIDSKLHLVLSSSLLCGVSIWLLCPILPMNVARSTLSSGMSILADFVQTNWLPTSLTQMAPWTRVPSLLKPSIRFIRASPSRMMMWRVKKKRARTTTSAMFEGLLHHSVSREVCCGLEKV